MDWREVLGWLAATSTIIFFVPGWGSQAYYNWRRGSTHGLHPLPVHVAPLSAGLWTVWGVIYGLWPPIVTNVLGVIFATIILVQYYILPREETKK